LLNMDIFHLYLKILQLPTHYFHFSPPLRWLAIFILSLSIHTSAAFPSSFHQSHTYALIHYGAYAVTIIRLFHCRCLLLRHGNIIYVMKKRCHTY
jgi:hypothetical protein